MEKSKSRIKVASRNQEVPSASELRVPGFGEKKIMSDSESAAYRERLVAAGTVTPNANQTSYMSPDQIQAYRNSLIKNGLLSPGTGLAKLKASQERRAKMVKPRKETEVH